MTVKKRTRIRTARRRGPDRAPRIVAKAGEAAFREQGYITPEEAGALTGAAKPTVYGWARRGLLDQANPTPQYRAVVRAPDARTWLLRAAVEALRPPAGKLAAAGG